MSTYNYIHKNTYIFSQIGIKMIFHIGHDFSYIANSGDFTTILRLINITNKDVMMPATTMLQEKNK